MCGARVSNTIDPGRSIGAKDINNRSKTAQFDKRNTVRLSNRNVQAQANSWALRSRLAASMIGKKRCSSSVRLTRPAWVLTFSAASTWPEAS
ncbi:hypothetical protein D3C81_1240050 [compost metagenome]